MFLFGTLNQARGFQGSSFCYITSCWKCRARGLAGGGAFRTDPLRISEETLKKIILFILTDALNIHMAFVCIGTFSGHTHSVWIHNETVDFQTAESVTDRVHEWDFLQLV